MVTNRGRPSTASLAAPQFRPPRLQPPAELSGRAREVFAALIAAQRRSIFRRSTGR
jgi:hypothetical protein